jgi:hypothetical protein
MKHMFLVVALPLVASGCAATLPEVVVLGNRPDGVSDIVPVAYQSPLGGYTHRAPADPKPWRELNDAQAPDGGA